MGTDNRGIRVVQLVLAAAAVMGGANPAHATVACGFPDQKLGSYAVAPDHPVKSGACGRLHPASILDTKGRRVMHIGDVPDFVDFQLLEDRYVFWGKARTIYEADLQARTKHAVFEGSAKRGYSKYTVSPGRARVALMYKSLVTWAEVSSQPSSVEHELYHGLTPSEALMPVAWSSDERIFWFCRVQYPSHRVRVVGVSVDGPSFTSASLSGDIPVCNPSPVKPENQAAPGYFHPGGGYFFQYAYDKGPPAVWHLFLHDPRRSRVADLGEIDDPHGVYWNGPSPRTPAFAPDGSCSYIDGDGRKRTATDPASLFPASG